MSVDFAPDWEQLQLAEALTDTFDGAWGPEAQNGAGVPVLRSTNMRGGTLSFTDVAMRDVSERILLKKKLELGDILVNKSSGSPKLVGASVLFDVPPDDRSYLCSNFIRCLRPNEEKLLAPFLYWQLQSPQFRNQVFAAQRTTSGLRNLKVKDYLAATIARPDIQEQARIVGTLERCLERTDELRHLRETSIAEAQSLEAAVFADFTDDFCKRHKDTPFVKLGEVIARAQYGTSSKANTDGEGVPILRMGNLQNGHLDTSDLKHIVLNDKDLSKYRLNEGDILFNRTNSLELVGKSATVNNLPGDWVFASYLIRIEVDRTTVLPEYVNAVINGRIGRDFVHRTARRAIGMVNINAKQIRELEFPLPSVSAQSRIIGHLNEAKLASDAIQRELELKPVSALPTAILRRAFAGEL